MDHSRTISGGGEDNVGIPDDLRCKRSDGKQWRCTAVSMPDKTVCEKHYIQAKKRAANSAMRASMKKTKRKRLDESEIYLESKSDDMDLPLSSQFAALPGFSGKKKKDKITKNTTVYSPAAPPVTDFSGRSSLRSTDDADRDDSENEESRMSYRTPSTSAANSDRSRSQKTFEISPMTEASDGGSESSDDTGGQPCHQCRSNSRDRVIWCLKCDRRGYCERCILTWYSSIPVEEIERVCPACRGICSCKVCLRGDNLIKARIREIPVKDKLQYLYCLLSAVLPIVKRIHAEQSSEVELEKRLRGNEIDLSRTKLNADEQMCCDFCRFPIIDYHRHCTNCSYDLCLSCCKDVRGASKLPVKEEYNHVGFGADDRDEAVMHHHVDSSDDQLKSFEKFAGWKADTDESIPCPPKTYGGCGSTLLTLKRIFKMNWVAKLVRNVDEMVSGCKINNSSNSEETGLRLGGFQVTMGVNESSNFLHHLSSEDLKNGGVGDFRRYWGRGEPVIVKEVCDASTMSAWDPMVIWRGIKETMGEKLKDEHRTVRAVDCSSMTEINIELGEFMKGYFEGRVNENGQPQMLKLKDWPSPSSSEEFLLYQTPDFICKLPLLEFIHSKWGLLNVAAKLPHYSLQSDVGPKIFISYGHKEEIGGGNSTDNLHLNMRDMVFLLVHACEVKSKDVHSTMVEIQHNLAKSEAEELPLGSEIQFSSDKSPRLSTDEGSESDIHLNQDKTKNGHGMMENCGFKVPENKSEEGCYEKAKAGACWDIFRREDIPKLLCYISMNEKEIRMADSIIDNYVSRPLYDGTVYLNGHHKCKLKEEFGVDPWSFEQHIGDAVFIPAGCPFQVRHLQSSVQLALDFLSPESLSEAVRLSEEIRRLPNDHAAKLHMMEIGKISLYAASSSIKEVQKLVLDPKLGPELGFEDPNLTSLVSENLENIVKRRQMACT